jgi:hypothetical protein
VDPAHPPLDSAAPVSPLILFVIAACFGSVNFWKAIATFWGILSSLRGTDVDREWQQSSGSHSLEVCRLSLSNRSFTLSLLHQSLPL